MPPDVSELIPSWLPLSSAKSPRLASIVYPTKQWYLCCPCPQSSLGQDLVVPLTNALWTHCIFTSPVLASAETRSQITWLAVIFDRPGQFSGLRVFWNKFFSLSSSGFCSIMLVTWEAKVSFIFGPVASCVFAFFSRLERNLFEAADLSSVFLLLGSSAWPVADLSVFCASIECFSEALLTSLMSSCSDIFSESSL